MNLRALAKVFGIVFVLVGMLGFVPPAAPNGMLLGLFHVNVAHNIVHIASGGAALYAAASGETASRYYFRIFGVVYALVAVLGFFVGHGHILGIVANNPADNFLHVAIAAVSLWAGFAWPKSGSLRA